MTMTTTAAPRLLDHRVDIACLMLINAVAAMVVFVHRAAPLPLSNLTASILLGLLATMGALLSNERFQRALSLHAWRVPGARTSEAVRLGTLALLGVLAPSVTLAVGGLPALLWAVLVPAAVGWGWAYSRVLTLTDTLLVFLAGSLTVAVSLLSLLKPEAWSVGWVLALGSLTAAAAIIVVVEQWPAPQALALARQGWLRSAWSAGSPAHARRNPENRVLSALGLWTIPRVGLCVGVVVTAAAAVVFVEAVGWPADGFESRLAFLLLVYMPLLVASPTGHDAVSVWGLSLSVVPGIVPPGRTLQGTVFEGAARMATRWSMVALALLLLGRVGWGWSWPAAAIAALGMVALRAVWCRHFIGAMLDGERSRSSRHVYPLLLTALAFSLIFVAELGPREASTVVGLWALAAVLAQTDWRRWASLRRPLA